MLSKEIVCRVVRTKDRSLHTPPTARTHPQKICGSLCTFPASLGTTGSGTHVIFKAQISCSVAARCQVTRTALKALPSTFPVCPRRGQSCPSHGRGAEGEVPNSRRFARHRDKQRALISSLPLACGDCSVRPFAKPCRDEGKEAVEFSFRDSAV